MIRGWKNSNWTRRRARAFESLTEARPEVERSGRHTLAERPEGAATTSFYTRPVDVPKLAAFPEGVSAELKRHLIAQGLTRLAANVDDLVDLGDSVAERDTSDDTVGDLVYEMH